MEMYKIKAVHRKYGDPKSRSNKYCPHCKKFLSLNNFYNDKYNTDGKTSRCKKLMDLKRKEYRASLIHEKRRNQIQRENTPTTSPH